MTVIPWLLLSEMKKAYLSQVCVHLLVEKQSQNSLMDLSCKHHDFLHAAHFQVSSKRRYNSKYLFNPVNKQNRDDSRLKPKGSVAEYLQRRQRPA